MCREQVQSIVLRASDGVSYPLNSDLGWESRPGEFHPEALAEPYVTLSRHTAPIKEPPRIMVQCANSSGERRETAAIDCRARRV
jgi:hypothetical protein